MTPIPVMLPVHAPVPVSDRRVAVLEAGLARDPECEVRPNPHEELTRLRLPHCSITVTHFVATACVPMSGLACNAIAEWFTAWIADGKACPWCRKPSADCWSIRPA